MKNKTFITTLFVIAITLCLSGCKYSNEAVSSIINDLGLESTIKNVGSSINPAISQMKNALSNTYWDAPLSLEGVFAQGMPELTIFLSLAGKLDEWLYTTNYLLASGLFISNNSMAFYIVDDYGHRKVIATSKSFRFNEEGAEAVFNLVEDEEQPHIVKVKYLDEMQAQVAIEDSYGYCDGWYRNYTRHI